MAEPNELDPKPLRPMDAVGDSRRLDSAPAGTAVLDTGGVVWQVYDTGDVEGTRLWRSTTGQVLTQAAHLLSAGPVTALHVPGRRPAGVRVEDVVQLIRAQDIGPFGPNTLPHLSQGGTTRLSLREAHEVARELDKAGLLATARTVPDREEAILAAATQMGLAPDEVDDVVASGVDAVLAMVASQPSEAQVRELAYYEFASQERERRRATWDEFVRPDAADSEGGDAPDLAATIEKVRQAAGSCERFTQVSGRSCRDENSGKDITSPYIADGYCLPCKILAIIDGGAP